MRFAASLVGSDDAADLVSEVVVATLQRRSLASIEHPQAYLIQATLNRARSRGRRFVREQRALARQFAGLSVEPPDSAQSITVARAVAGLPPQQRAAIYLVYWEGLEPAEAASLLGLRPATLRRYLYLARNKLRRFLDD